MSELTNNEYLVEQCVFKGLVYLSETLQYYWPGRLVNEGGQPNQNRINIIAENNIALHLARSFSENGFLVWAEVPFQNAEKKLRVDFLAYHYSQGILATLELKNNMSTPQNNLADLRRLVDISRMDLISEDHAFNNAAISRSPHKIYGIISLLERVEFADWWHSPQLCQEFTPQYHNAPDYKIIGQALAKADCRSVQPLIEMRQVGRYPETYKELCDVFRNRLIRAGYALYNEATIKNELEPLLNS
jgi:hypothetical protein